ncbi:AraC family transcriptional regulator ligand-binding domain-containing protein, partial [Oleiphilus sp. HI0066]|uniref:AraC family transcriptional regulator ligand-binding domain-containing protein n=4 Tax=Oleiphilus TaxID=141450 RepID=UPI0012E8EED2
VGQNLYAKLKQPIADAVYYGLQVRPSSHGALGVAIQTSASLRAGLSLLTKYYNTRLAAQYPKIVIGEEHVSLTLITDLKGMGHSPDVQRFFDLSTMVSMAQSVHLSLGASCALEGQVIIEIDAPEPAGFPHHVLDYCCFTFNAKQCAMHFPTQWLDAPFESANTALCQAALAQCEEELRKVKPQDLVDRVRNFLTLQEGALPSIDVVAERNFMSAATLKRKLGELDYTYQDLKNEVRLFTAKEKLSSSEL